MAVDKSIFAVSEQGQELFQINSNIKWFIDLETSADGDIAFLAASGTEDGLTLGIVDPEQKGAVQYYKGIKGANLNGNLARGESGELYLSCNGNVYVYDKEQGAMTEEFAWNESRINSNKVRFLSAAGENRFVAVLTEEWENNTPPSLPG